MKLESIWCPGGRLSQSGLAAAQRYTECTIEKVDSIEDFAADLDNKPGPYLVPIWNSHEGEIERAQGVWDSLQTAKIRIYDLWPKQIRFTYYTREKQTVVYNKIASVVVAKTQCSKFIENRQFEFIPKKLTTVALEEFRDGAEWDGVLLAPGAEFGAEGFQVSEEHVENLYNFTTFALVASSKLTLEHEPSPNGFLTGVSLPAFRESLSEATYELFSNLFETAQSVDEVPKLVFVLKRVGRVGLLFQGEKLTQGALLDAEAIESEDIHVVEDAGSVEREYSQELGLLFEKTFPDLLQPDFWIHTGTKTCLFACPMLGVFVHGYEIEAVEPVVRFYISQYFQAWDNGLPCTSEQDIFFAKYKDAWLDNGSEFIQFTGVGV